MAESANFHIERRIPEFDQMKRLKLFKQDEIDEIIKRRTDFEHKLERTKKEKQDFLSYISYEVKLIRDIKLRRDKYKIKEKKDEIEYSIMKRVTKLYQIALLYFKSDVKLWMSYINFCTQTKFVNSVSEALKQMLQVHSDKVHLWRYASKWELEEMNNTEGALNFLKTGLHHHPSSQELYTEAFSVELLSGSQKNSSIIDAEDEQKRQDKCLQRAEVHFKTSIKVVKDDVQYIIGLLEIATQYDYTEQLQRQIVEHLTTTCWKSELMWHTMAQRELKGYHYDKNNENKSRIQLCIAVYKSAIKVLPTALMWEKYLDTLVDLYHDKRKKSIRDTLEAAFQEAYDAGFLVEKHYLEWVQLFENDNEKHLNILVMATAVMPHSSDLWIMRLRHHLAREQDEQVCEVAREAIKSLKEKSLEIYKTLLQFYTVRSASFSEMKTIYEEGINREPEVSLELRPMYIEWLFLVKNIKAARAEYEKIANNTPYCLELHRKMIFLEYGRNGSSCDDAIRKIHNLTCHQFGRDRVDVWIDYIKFEMSANPRAVSDIYANAKNTLKDHLVVQFTAEFALLNTSI